MMAETELTRHNILLRKGDLAAFQALYGNQASAVIRSIIANTVDRRIKPQLEKQDDEQL